MSKINRIRIVNLSYNNKSNRVDDELFCLDCEDTMMSLRNGGGKSVLVQMIMAPFVNKRYRDVGERKFENYFTSTVPTYILVEWKLDHGSGYVLTGMMVRKKDSIGDEEFASKLDMINFVYEYKEKNPYDIKNMPVVCEGEKGRRFESYGNSKKLFEELKKNKSYKFNYYDMTNSSTTSAYFTKLMEYDINHKEWENIIRKINQKESGLSELFTNAKNVTGLVREWFIPAVEEKLSKDDDRIKGFREIINKYIKSYKDNKTKIDKMEKMELFNKLAEEIKVNVQNSIDIMSEREKLENEIANIMVYLENRLEETKENIESLEEKKASLKEALLEIEYEESSLHIYNKKDEENELDKQIVELNCEKSELENHINSVQRRVNVYDCAQLHSNYVKYSRQYLELEQKLEYMKKQNMDMTPRIDNLGYTMSLILKRDEEEVEGKIIHRKKIIEEFKDEKIAKNTELDNCIKSLGELRRLEGSLGAKVSEFDKREQKFNSIYKENFRRSIEKLYDEKKLYDFKDGLINSKDELIKEEKKYSEELMVLEDRRRVTESSIDATNTQKINVDNDLKVKKEKLLSIEEELGKRSEILKYVDLNEDYLFDISKIIGKFNDKIDLLLSKQREIKNNIDKEENEIYKLETGKVMEISQELHREFKRYDIDVVYGMEWLKNNGRSEEDNNKIIKNNPLLPYALIMSDTDINKLKENNLEVFTSVPIVIVKRESINEKLTEEISNIVSLGNIDFLVSFNKKLLNEEELKKLICEKRELLKEYGDNLNTIKDHIDMYSEKKAFVQASTVTEEGYNEVKVENQRLEAEQDALEIKFINLNKELGEIEHDIANVSTKRECTKTSIEDISRKTKDFEEFMESYVEYKENLHDSMENAQNIVNVEQGMDILRKSISSIEEQLQQFSAMLNEYKSKRSTINEKQKKYAIYKSGEVIEKDREDIEAEYEALKSKITDTEKQLKERIVEADTQYKKARDILISRSEEYGLEEKEYIDVTYDLEEEQELKKELKEINSSLKKLKDVIGHRDRNKIKLESDIENLMGIFKKTFNTDVLMCRERIFEKNYNEEKNKVSTAIRNVEKSMSELQNIGSELDKNLSNLKEYDELKVKEVMEISIDVYELSDTIGRKRRDFTKLRNKYEESINDIHRQIDDKLRQNQCFTRDDSFNQPVEIFIRLVNRPQELLMQIDTIVNSYMNTMEKLKHDISLVTKEEESILDDLSQYIGDINDNLTDIDNNSTINVCGKSRKMLNVIVENWENNKELYRIRLRDYFEEIRESGLKVLDENKNIEDVISSKITSYNLYNEVVGVSTIKVKLFKIEEEKQRQISWNEVATNSGGEGFLSSFIILSSLLSYTRRNLNDVFSKNESGKVLIMDNPFAQTSSSHLLKPLMEMAKKSNTQLICFTGLGGESIYDRFDNIYVLNTKQSRMQNGTQYLKGEHKKGEKDEENYEHLESSRTQITEQMRLF